MRRAFDPKEDQELVKAYVNGNEDAFAELMHRHQNRIFTTIFFIVKDRALAEDIFQESMIKIIRLINADKYDEKGKFVSWAVRIARNLAIDYYRKDRRSPQLVRENDEYDIFNSIGKIEDNIEEKIIKEENARYIRDLITRIPEKQREVLIMRHYAGLSFKEIADVQGVNINTALGRMRYALINLRKFAGVSTKLIKNEEVR
ncbi:MAG TPA: sigma-70 family RNA polymerase sigma factor [Bacteroidetes bacterium]|nr:sigma-70 family RNA polymerase sigma factor [Bacteroidota bacterium]